MRATREKAQILDATAIARAITRIAHEMFTDERTARLLEESHREADDQTRQSAIFARTEALVLESAAICRARGPGLVGVADVEEAIRLANDSPYGLNASVWSGDLARGMAIAARLESGNTCVNDCVLSAGVPALPFGGVKQSGVGTRHGGAEGLRQFCVRQALLVEPRRRRRREPAWFPYSTARARQLERRMGWLW